jgi:hypothetical protein
MVHCNSQVKNCEVPPIDASGPRYQRCIDRPPVAMHHSGWAGLLQKSRHLNLSHRAGAIREGYARPTVRPPDLRKRDDKLTLCSNEHQRF